MKIYSSDTFLLTLSGILILLLSCSDLSAQNRQTVEESEQINARSAYIEGLAAFENENYQHALELLKAAYVKLPDQPGVNFALADAYLMMGDIANAEYYGKQAVKLDPGNQWYRLKLVRIYRDTGKNTAAIDELKNGLRYDSENTNLLHELAQTYSDHGQPKKSNTIYNNLLYLKGEDLSIRLQKLEHFNSLNMQDSAIVELQKIRDLAPDNLSTMHVLSNHYKKMDRMDEAKEVLNNALKLNNSSTETLIMLSDIHLQQAQWDSLTTLLHNAVSDSALTSEKKMELGRYLYSAFESDSKNPELRQVSASVFQKLMEAEPKSGPIQSLAADFFARTDNYELALQALERTTSLTPTNDSAWQQRLQLLLTKGNIKEAIAVGEQAAQEIPQDAIILYLLGSAHLSDQNHEQAIPYLNEASQLPARRPLKSNILTSLGDAHAALEQWKNAFQHYEEALKINPEHAAALNNYAYHLSLQKQELSKAREMAQQAVQLDPKNPSYLDTIGWICYQQGDYKKAEKYIRSSIDTGRASAEVMEHLGDVLDKLNQSAEARQWWQKALEKDSSRTHLKDKISTQ